MKSFATILFILLSNIGISQTAKIPYTRNYEFNEGVYLTVHQFNNNSPIPKSSIISDFPKTELDFLKQVVRGKTIYYMDETNLSKQIAPSSIWGYCQNGTIHINYNDDFNRVNVIGSIFQFTSLITVSPGFMDPMYSNYGLSTTVEELRQFIYDTRTNKIHSFDVKSLGSILKNDPELYGQFSEMKRRKKIDSQFLFLRKYNEKYPLMLPE